MLFFGSIIRNAFTFSSSLNQYLKLFLSKETLLDINISSIPTLLMSIGYLGQGNMLFPISVSPNVKVCLFVFYTLHDKKMFLYFIMIYYFHLYQNLQIN